MKKEDFWFLLWGIAVGFSLQVLYDGFGEYPSYTLKFLGGAFIEIVFLAGLLLYGFLDRSKKC
jgi:hypothetical protein